jgi:hypothetical protein
MTEWLLLLLIVPAIVVPVVLLFGFAGCGFQAGVAPPSPLVIDSAVGKSASIITLMWSGGVYATMIEFERTKAGAPPNQPTHRFQVMPSPTTFDDGDGLEPATTYSYRAREVYADGETSEWTAPVLGTTLASEVTFDAAGAGSSGSDLNSVTITWSHTASGDSRAVVVGLRWAHTAGVGSPTRTVTYGVTPMTSIGVIGLNNAAITALNGTYHEFFGLLAPPTGVQTVSLTVSRTGALSVAVTGSSVSYVEVSAFGSVASVAGTEAGTALSQTVSSAVHEMVVQMFSTASGAIGGYDQTLRFDDGANGFVIGDARGAASVPFIASRANGVDYAGLAVRLAPG